MIRYNPVIRVMACLPIFLPVLSLCGQQPVERRSVTTHQGFFNAQHVNYRADVREYFFKPDSLASPAVTAISTSYVKLNVPVPGVRPILFIFNGGPGASSSPLHMNAFGPVRIQREKDSSRIIDNPYCLLDVADLVFIDPPGTGFTRVFDSASAARYWDVNGDAELFLDLVKRWKTENKRESSPVFLCGESYGTMRAAAMMGLAKDLPVSGAILLASVFDFSLTAPAPGNDMPYVLFLPGMAAVAWYHSKSEPGIKDAGQAYNEAMHFALNDYLPALAKGIHLTAEERDRIATRVSAIMGLSKKIILEKNLRVTPKDFQLLLLADKDKRVGQLNGQITGPLHNPGAKPPFDDPSMSFNPSTRGLVGNYFNRQLRFEDSSTYKSLNLGVNSRWNFTNMSDEFGYWTVAHHLVKAMKDQPRLKLLVAGGYYDLATPPFAARYVLEHIDVPAERVSYADFPTGHSIFDNETELKKLAGLVRSFIAPQNND